MTTDTLACIGLGANLGNPQAALRAALDDIARLPGSVLLATSPIYRTAPVDATGPDYLNAVALLRTALTPHALLAALQRIEHAHGRERSHRNAPRTLDLDLLLYGDERIESPALTLPHPRLHQRAFVLRPLADVMPAGVIPGLGPIADWLPRVADQRIERLDS
ncbi:2-amino-4-hydroxy-6-hydroxymethyldihydropteridine diphosphokinase [Piscinibacter sp.]|uniref:2-amino-4-hydroxy-6- hydroxymethyldihydropteridine diphosphokinase n=1 Tax=Piscinibacter sp. TaxID=1903157 RepID=UPI002C242E63|nr:2-amino-4-hydroxy-6-hydroxymethyldihydropteridine diphosphokinase [Albitalea sp.]HUG24842.1 2-amino-4-hydroxy-6-hydroxymethyldihydropteridine diphosphokinase [Albitalea sp.]